MIDLKGQTDQWLFQAMIANGEQYERLAVDENTHQDELNALRDWLEREWSDEYSVKVNSIADESHSKIQEKYHLEDQYLEDSD